MQDLTTAAPRHGLDNREFSSARIAHEVANGVSFTPDEMRDALTALLPDRSSRWELTYSVMNESQERQGTTLLTPYGRMFIVPQYDRRGSLVAFMVRTTAVKEESA